MVPTMSALRVLAAVTVTVGLVAACSTNDDDTTSPTTTTEASAQPSTTMITAPPEVTIPDPGTIDVPDTDDSDLTAMFAQRIADSPLHFTEEAAACTARGFVHELGGVDAFTQAQITPESIGAHLVGGEPLDLAAALGVTDADRGRLAAVFEACGIDIFEQETLSLANGAAAAEDCLRRTITAEAAADITVRVILGQPSQSAAAMNQVVACLSRA